MSVLIAGSSHVRRLNDYVEARQAFKNFDLHNINVEFYGIGGGRVMNSGHTSQINSKIQSSQPDHVVLHIGGNDLDVIQVNEQYCEELVLKLVLLAETFISRHRLQSVTICELLPRQKTRHITVEKYNYFKKITNKFIKKELVAKSKIHFWKIKGVKESLENLFGDGVHFNDDGNLRYYRSIRGALINLSK